MGETTIERKKKRGEPFNPFASDANSQRNQRHNKRAQSSPQRSTRTPNQPVKNNTLEELDKKRKEALTRMSESKPNTTASQTISETTTAGISQQNQKQQSTEKTSSRADRLAELRKKSAASKLNAEQQKLGGVVEEIAPVVEVVPEVKLVEAKTEIESFSAVAKTSAKPAISQLNCLLYTSPSPRDQRGSRMPSSA